MSKQIIEWIGPTPSDEDSAQSGEPDFIQKNRAECNRFRDLLLKAFPPPPFAYLVIRKEDHDFGPYREVVTMMEESLSQEDMATFYKWNSQVSSCPSTWIELEALANQPF